ncbi:beta-fructofuranosidase-like protein [Leishmania tarentolae]|uniref:Beta-fructofuranosidase-like protein n=1 Tax=Leishmania tarentolae TaxID=5689 RepID=A0A640KY34_LEITA|nr:beta-fructofuranosidase-like protein [Leishmania tarentolae]
MKLLTSLSLAAWYVALCVCTTPVGGYGVTLISDIHYDPLYGTSKAYVCTSSSSPAYSMQGCDSSSPLTTSAMDDVSAQNPSLVLYTGDWQRHHFSDSGLPPAAIFENLSKRFKGITVDGSLGAVAFGGALGNNDVVPDYYFSWENETSERELGYRVAAMHEATLLNDAEASVMRTCGYYTHTIDRVHVIVLHTLLWAYDLQPALLSNVSDPCNQFSFLRSELEKVRAAKKRAIIMGHIPPGVNTYSVLKRGFHSATRDMFWKEEYEATYDSIINEYKEFIAVQLFGHTHMFRLLTMRRNGALAIIIPSISPIFGNYPSYLMANFSEAWELEDLQSRHTTGEGVFQPGLFVKEVLSLSTGLHSVTDVRAAITLLGTNDTMWEGFLTLFCGGEKRLQAFPHKKCDNLCRYVIVCSMLENNYTDIQRCVDDYNVSPGPSQDAKITLGITVAIIVFSVLVIGAGVALLLVTYCEQATLWCSGTKISVCWEPFGWKKERHTTSEIENELEDVPERR